MTNGQPNNHERSTSGRQQRMPAPVKQTQTAGKQGGEQVRLNQSDPYFSGICFE